MTFSRQASRIYMDAYDVDGACTRLMREITEGEYTARAEDFLMGAFSICNLIRNHERIDTQDDLMVMLDRVMDDGGLIPHE